MNEIKAPPPRPSKRYGTKVLLGTAAIAAFIGVWEGGKKGDGSSVVYADKLAQGLPTVCHGLTKHITTTPIIVGEKWSAEKCINEEQAAIIKIQDKLQWCFGPMAPPQSVFDAATSFAWNAGVPSACGTGAMRAWQVGEWQLGCRRLVYADGSTRPVWSYVKTGRTLPNGKPEYKFVQGLFNRRSAEYTYCMKEVK